jgi:hypothetical protein
MGLLQIVCNGGLYAGCKRTVLGAMNFDGKLKEKPNLLRAKKQIPL